MIYEEQVKNFVTEGTKNGTNRALLQQSGVYRSGSDLIILGILQSTTGTWGSF